MGFNAYPYTDLHEMNLDWILKKVKEMIAEWDTTKNAWNALKEFVETYFENLDVQQEINNKLDEMAAGGELAELMQPYIDEKLPLAVADQIADIVALQIGAVVASQLPVVVSDQLPAVAEAAAAAEVGTWLEAHVDPDTGYVIDDTLLVEGAAADAKETGLRAGVIQSVSTGADLNDMTAKGWYRLSYSGTYLNGPIVSDANLFKFVEVFIQGTHIVQRYISYKSTSTRYEEYLRVFNGEDWETWVKGFSSLDAATLFVNMSDNQSVSSGTDLNTLTDRGFFRLSYSGTYVNSPVADETDKYKFVEILKQGSQCFQRYTLYKHGSPRNYEQYIRIWDGTAWKEWTKGFSTWDFNAIVDSLTDDVKESFTGSAMTSQGTNDGLKLRVLSYNASQYNNDTETYISDDKLFNLRRMINEANADLIFMQEDRAYIDSANTKASKDYVFLPAYPNNEGSGSCAVRSKMAQTNGGLVSLSGDRMLRYCVITIGDVKLLAASAHPISNYNSTGKDSAESISMRATEYQEIMEWVNGDETLPDYSTAAAVTVPTHTHAIVGMDANSWTATDKSNLATLAADRGFVLANGTYLGWLKTEMRNNAALDNVIASDNVIFNSFKVLNSEYANLYSDHVPLIADVTLT